MSMKCFLVISIVLTAAFFTTFWYWIANSSTFRGSCSQVKSPLIIFDFDGTICPSYPLFIDQINILADEQKLRKIGGDEFEEVRNMTPKNIMKMLGVTLFKLPFILKRVRRNVQNQLLELNPVSGVVEVLRELKRRRYSLGILTSNSSENVLLYLQKYRIDFFDFVYAGNNIFGKEKHLKDILKNAHLNPQKDLMLYVGDEVRDIEAAQKARFTSIGVTWGYNSLKLLQESNPDFLSEEPSQILVLIDSAAESFATCKPIFSN